MTTPLRRTLVFAMLAIATLALSGCSGRTITPTVDPGKRAVAVTMRAEASCAGTSPCSFYFRYYYRTSTGASYGTGTLKGPVTARTGVVVVQDSSPVVVPDASLDSFRYQICGWGDGVGSPTNPVCIGPDANGAWQGLSGPMKAPAEQLNWWVPRA